MITYKTVIKVYLSKKLIGEIRDVQNGFAYFPKGSKESGIVFSSINGVKSSL